MLINAVSPGNKDNEGCPEYQWIQLVPSDLWVQAPPVHDALRSTDQGKYKIMNHVFLICMLSF